MKCDVEQGLENVVQELLEIAHLTSLTVLVAATYTVIECFYTIEQTSSS